MEVQQVATELQAAVVTNELQAAVGCSQRQLAWQLLLEIVGSTCYEMPGSCCSQDSVYSAALAMTRDCHYTWPFYAHACTCQD